MAVAAWYESQCAVLGSALIDPELVPLVVSELTAEDFSGMARSVFEAMLGLFRDGEKVVDILAVLSRMGESESVRDYLLQLMEVTPTSANCTHYIEVCRNASKLSRLKDLGHALDESSSYAEANKLAEQISDTLVDRSGMKAYDPAELIAGFEADLKRPVDFLPWPFAGMDGEVFVDGGCYVILMAEPSGGKTALALQLLLLWAKTKRVLFLSQETTEAELFLRMAACLSGVSLRRLLQRKLDEVELRAVRAQYEALRKLSFKLIPTESVTTAEAKAAAIKYQADIVIIDYLQIMKGDGNSRPEVVGEISRQLQAMAKSTGKIVVALSQVTIRDPSLRNKPLDMHSGRESAELEQNADLMLALDKFVEKEVKEAAPVDRVLRIVKNKRGQLFRIPLLFDGRHQRFAKIEMSSAVKAAMEAAGRKAKQISKAGACSKPENSFEQLPMNTEVPFDA